MASEHVQPASNLVKSMTLGYMEKFIDDGKTLITPAHIDGLETSFHAMIKSDFPAHNHVSKNFVREKIVGVILEYYGTGIFGVGEFKPKEEGISEKTLKKYKDMVKRGKATK